MTKRFSASSAAMMMACPASANLDLAIPNWVAPVIDPMKGAKGKGTEYHKFFENIVELPAKDIHNFASALQYMADLRSTRRFTVLTEEPVVATWLVSQPGTTADVVLFTQDEIHVVDFKTGKIPVEVVDNEQLLFYAVCYAPLAPRAKGVTLHIVQPWAGGNHSWYADTNRLARFIVEAQDAEKLILAGDTTFGPSDHCKFCPANPHSRGDKGKPLCPAMMQLLYPKLLDEDAVLAL